MKHRQTPPAPPARINVTPIIDVALVLVIILLVTAQPLAPLGGGGEIGGEGGGDQGVPTPGLGVSLGWRLGEWVVGGGVDLGQWRNLLLRRTSSLWLLVLSRLHPCVYPKPSGPAQPCRTCVTQRTLIC